MQADLHLYIEAVWIAVGVVWIAGAARTKRTARVQTAVSRWLHLGLAAAAFTLVFRPELGLGPLGRRFVPASAAVAYTGLALTISGAAFAIWARLLLGRNWSAVVTIKEGHRMVRTGPYAVVRHPIYSGFLLALLGTSLAFGEVRCLAGFAVAFVAWWTKSRLEEKFLEREFGSEYAVYRQHVKALVPFVL
jgi:protein-S-isoprenylcysteine O-methyltransferase Ste14